MANRFYTTHQINPLVVKMMDGNAADDVMHLEFPGYKNIMHSCNLESYV